MKNKLICVSLLSMGALTTSLAYTYKVSLGIENLSLFNKQEEDIDLSIEDIEDLFDNEAKQVYDGTPKSPALKPGKKLPDDIYIVPQGPLLANVGNSTMPYIVYQKSPVPGGAPISLGELDLTVIIIRTTITTVSFNTKIVTTNQLPYIYAIEGVVPDEVIRKTSNNANGILYKYNGKSQKAPFSFSAIGKYDVTYSVVQTTNYLKLDLKGTLYIIPCLKSGTTIFDKNEHSKDAKIAESQLPQGVTVSYEFHDESGATVNELINAGVYKVIMYMSISGVVISKEESTYTITKESLPPFTFEESNTPYDGTPKLVKVKENVPEGVEVKYTYTYIKDGVVVPNPTEAGDYKITVTIDAGPNYEYKGAIPTTTFTIEKAKLSGVFSDKTVLEDGLEHKLDFVGTLPTGVTLSYTNNNQVAVGTYLVKANIDGGVNYENLHLEATLMITPRITSEPLVSDVTYCMGRDLVLNVKVSKAGLKLYYYDSSTSITPLVGVPTPTVVEEKTYYVAEGEFLNGKYFIGAKKVFKITSSYCAFKSMINPNLSIENNT